MTALRNVLLDLREKRLWPVALLLLAAIAAVPALVGAPNEGPPSAPVVGLAAGEVAGRPVTAQLQVEEPGRPAGRRRPGALRDPFFRALVSGREDAPSGAPPPGGTTTSTDATTGGAGGGPTTTDLVPLPDVGLPSPLPDPGPVPRPGPAPTPRPAPSGDPDVVTVRVGRAGELRLRRGVTAGSPLPSAADPFLVFLGTKPDGRSAQFLVSDEAVPTGDGRCRPSAETCELVVLEAGQTEYFDLAPSGEEPVQYQIDVLRVGTSRTAAPS